MPPSSCSSSSPNTTSSCRSATSARHDVGIVAAAARRGGVRRTLLTHPGVVTQGTAPERELAECGFSAEEPRTVVVDTPGRLVGDAIEGWRASGRSYAAMLGVGPGGIA